MRRLKKAGIAIFATVMFAFAFGAVAAAETQKSTGRFLLIEKVPTSGLKSLGLYGERFCKQEGWHCLFIKELNVYNLIEKKTKEAR